MELQGKKINFLGDSITEGGLASCKETRFTNLIADWTGAVCRNYGVSGTRIARQHVPSKNPLYDQDFCIRAEQMDPDADVIIVFGGTNDFGQGDAPLGTPADRTKDTFWGALHVLYTTLIERYPEAKIVVLTPLHRRNEDDPCGSSKTEPIAVLKEYVKIIREAAEYYALPVLDLYANSGIQPNLPAIKERFFPDALHPNDAGHVILAEKIISFLKQL